MAERERRDQIPPESMLGKGWVVGGGHELWVWAHRGSQRVGRWITGPVPAVAPGPWCAAGRHDVVGIEAQRRHVRPTRKQPRTPGLNAGGGSGSAKPHQEHGGMGAAARKGCVVEAKESRAFKEEGAAV